MANEIIEIKAKYLRFPLVLYQGISTIFFGLQKSGKSQAAGRGLASVFGNETHTDVTISK